MGKPARKKEAALYTPEARREVSKKKFHPKDLSSVQPLTPRQKQLFHSYNAGFPVIVNMGTAGTGKTFLSMYLGLRDVLEGKQKTLIIVRSCVPSREVGFLPGTVEEKQLEYESPYADTCDLLFQYAKSYENLKELSYLDFISTSFIRGLTFDNAVILVDEMQNMTFQELNTVMTRVGRNSRIIFCGDTAQTDLYRNRSDYSGMREFLKVLEKMKDAAVIEFGIDDIQRSGIVKQYLIAKEQTGL